MSRYEPRLDKRGAVRERIEAMAARGVPIGRIVQDVGCNYAYAEQVIRIFRAYRTPGESLRADPDQDAAHVAACMAQGGFPAAAVIFGRTVWIGHHGGEWKAA